MQGTEPRHPAPPGGDGLPPEPTRRGPTAPPHTTATHATSVRLALVAAVALVASLTLAAVSAAHFGASTASANEQHTTEEPSAEEPSDSTNAGGDGSYDPRELEVVDLINEHRADNDLDPLAVSETASTAAENHSSDMAAFDFFDHDTVESDYYPEGATFDERMIEEGYDHDTARGENIAAGHEDPQSTFEQWQDSPGHNENMLREEFEVVGVGLVCSETNSSGCYWTTDFGGYADETTQPVDDLRADGSDQGPNEATEDSDEATEDSDEAMEDSDEAMEDSDEATGQTTDASSTDDLSGSEDTTGDHGDAYDAQATVSRAVDGDTVELEDPVEGNDIVRLIGVDTPEMDSSAGEAEPYAEEASEFTAENLEGEQVALEFDQEMEDDYGRLLAYVWTEPDHEGSHEATEQGSNEDTDGEAGQSTDEESREDTNEDTTERTVEEPDEGAEESSEETSETTTPIVDPEEVGGERTEDSATAEDDHNTTGTDVGAIEDEDRELFNELLLEDGYGELLIIDPNDRYADRLEEAEARARDDGRGIWADENDPDNEDSDATDHDGADPGADERTEPDPEPGLDEGTEQDSDADPGADTTGDTETTDQNETSEREPDGETGEDTDTTDQGTTDTTDQGTTEDTDDGTERDSRGGLATRCNLLGGLTASPLDDNWSADLRQQIDQFRDCVRESIAQSFGDRSGDHSADQYDDGERSNDPHVVEQHTSDSSDTSSDASSEDSDASGDGSREDAGVFGEDDPDNQGRLHDFLGMDNPRDDSSGEDSSGDDSTDGTSGNQQTSEGDTSEDTSEEPTGTDSAENGNAADTLVSPVEGAGPDDYSGEWNEDRDEAAGDGAHIIAEEGAPVMAMVDAEVMRPEETDEDYYQETGGYMVGLVATSDAGEIREGDLLLYGHLQDTPDVREGDTVAAGDEVGRVGDTGGGPPVTTGEVEAGLYLGWYTTDPDRQQTSNGAMDPRPLLEHVEEERR